MIKFEDNTINYLDTEYNKIKLLKYLHYKADMLEFDITYDIKNTIDNNRILGEYKKSIYLLENNRYKMAMKLIETFLDVSVFKYTIADKLKYFMDTYKESCREGSSSLYMQKGNSNDVYEWKNIFNIKFEYDEDNKNKLNIIQGSKIFAVDLDNCKKIKSFESDDLKCNYLYLIYEDKIIKFTISKYVQHPYIRQPAIKSKLIDKGKNIININNITLTSPFLISKEMDELDKEYDF